MSAAAIETAAGVDLVALVEAGQGMAAAIDVASLLEALCASLTALGGYAGVRDGSGAWVAGAGPDVGESLRLDGPAGEELWVVCEGADLALARGLVTQAESLWASIGTYETLETMVADEMATVVRREASIQLILDAMEDALVVCDRSGALTEIRSAASGRWFGEPAPGDTLWDYLRRDDPAAAEGLRLGFEQLTDGFFPFDVAAGQITPRFRREGRWFSLSFRPVQEGDAITGVVAVVADAEAEVAAERAAEDSRELVDLVQQLVADPTGTQAALGELRGLVERIGASDGAQRLGDLHTLKGGAGVMGLSRLAQAAHEAESRLAAGATGAEAASHVATAATQTWERLAPVLGHERRQLQIDPASLEEVLERLGPQAEVASIVSSWRHAPLQALLGQASHRLAELAARQGKQVEVTVQAGCVHAPSSAAESFARTLVHVVRNAVAHGIEPSDERVAVGKEPAGRLRLGSWRTAESVVIRIADDGRGIDWGAVAERAQARGLPASDHRQLVAALMAPGLTTRDGVDQLSGRGVGLSAVAAALEACGGEVEVASTRGVGTTWTFSLPTGG